MRRRNQAALLYAIFLTRRLFRQNMGDGAREELGRSPTVSESVG